MIPLVQGHGEVTLDEVPPGTATVVVNDLDKRLPKVTRQLQMPSGGNVIEEIVLAPAAPPPSPPAAAAAPGQ
jgi:hypothetical protein